MIMGGPGKTQEGNGPVQGADRRASRLVLEVCKSQPFAKGKLLDRSPLICIVCLRGWPTLLLLMLLSLLLVAACY